MMSREVGQSGDRWLASDGGVGSVVIVEVQPLGEGFVALRGGGIELRVGPAITQSAVETLDLAVGLGSVGSGPLGLDAQVIARISPISGAVARTVVGQDPFDHHASIGEPCCGSAEDADRGLSLLVSTDLRIGHPGVVIDDGMDVGRADPGV